MSLANGGELVTAWDAFSGTRRADVIYVELGREQNDSEYISVP